MRRLISVVTSVAAMTVVLSPAATLATSGTAVAAPSGETIVPMTQTLRRCDFSVAATAPASSGNARAVAVISTSGNTVSANVSVATAEPDTRYVVRLIQTPRPSSQPCAGGDPGVTESTLTTDAIGGGQVTLGGEIQQGATGAWVFFLRPGQYSQVPIVYATSGFIAKI